MQSFPYNLYSLCLEKEVGRDYVNLEGYDFLVLIFLILGVILILGGIFTNYYSVSFGVPHYTLFYVYPYRDYAFTLFAFGFTFIVAGIVIRFRAEVKKRKLSSSCPDCGGRNTHCGRPVLPAGAEIGRPQALAQS